MYRQKLIISEQCEVKKPSTLSIRKIIVAICLLGATHIKACSKLSIRNIIRSTCVTPADFSSWRLCLPLWKTNTDWRVGHWHTEQGARDVSNVCILGLVVGPPTRRAHSAGNGGLLSNTYNLWHRSSCCGAGFELCDLDTFLDLSQIDGLLL